MSVCVCTCGVHAVFSPVSFFFFFAGEEKQIPGQCWLQLGGAALKSQSPLPRDAALLTSYLLFFFSVSFFFFWGSEGAADCFVTADAAIIELVNWRFQANNN